MHEVLTLVQLFQVEPDSGPPCHNQELLHTVDDEASAGFIWVGREGEDALDVETVSYMAPLKGQGTAHIVYDTPVMEALQPGDWDVQASAIGNGK